MTVSQKLIENIEELRKSLNEISVYDFDVYTSMELYYKIANKLNEVIKELMRFEGVVSDEVVEQNEKLIYLIGEGLNIEVVKKINQMVQDGTMDSVINHNVFNSLNSQIKEIANKGTTVEVLERVTKEEIDRQIGDGTIANLTIEDFSIEKNKLKTRMVFGTESINMFDKNNVEIGKFIQYTTGECQEVGNPVYCASYFIPVIPGKTITMTYCDQSAFYTKTKEFVSGLPNLGFDAGAFTVVVPDTAYFIRVTVIVDYLDIYQIAYGDSLLEYESYDNKITRDNIRPNEKLIDVDNLMFDLNDYVTSLNRFMGIRKELNNSFKSTQIKFLGDSITAGMGASNFSLDKQYGGSNYIEDDMSINCYANLTRRYIHENYNTEKLINVLDSNIKCMNSAVIHEDNTRMLNWFLRTENRLIETFAQFELDSNYFSIYPFLNTNMGVFSVYVNGVWFKSIDCYHASIVGETEVVVDGLPNGHKIIELKSTTTKNDLSTGTRIDIGAIKVKKPIITKNYGVSGYNTKDIIDRIDTFVEDEDDIVFLQIGTNDRGYTKSESEFEAYYKKLIDTILSKGKILIVMSSLPASDENENNPVQNFKMKDVNRVIAKVADEKKLYFISNYNYIKRLLRIRGESIDTVLADGLHPNDLGYNELFNNIIENLNI